MQERKSEKQKNSRPYVCQKDESESRVTTLSSQTTHIDCLIEYGRSDTPALDDGVRSVVAYFHMGSVRSSKMYSRIVSMSLSSAGIFLFGIRNATLSFHSLS